MAQTQNAPGTGSVANPGGARFPVNTAQTVGVGQLGGMSQAPAIQPVPAAQSAPGVPSGGVQRGGSTLPLNASMTQTVGAPAQFAAPASGSFATVSTVSDPGAPRFAVGQVQTVGMPPDTATPGGGDPSATGGYIPGPTSSGPQWSQFDVAGNPNAGAIGGSATVAAPSYLPGQTGRSQVSPGQNPNPGNL